MSKYTKTERSEALGSLRKLLRPGDTVHTIVEDGGEPVIGQLERDTDDRLARWAAPLVGEIEARLPARDLLAQQLAAQPLDELLDPRASQRQTEIADPPLEQVVGIPDGAVDSVHGNLLYPKKSWGGILSRSHPLHPQP